MELSDLEALKTLFAKRGVGFAEETNENGTRLMFETGMENVVGYSGFMTEMNFAADGTLMSVGAWE